MTRGGLLFGFLISSSLLVVAAGCSSSSSGSTAGGACANYASALIDTAKQCGQFNVSPSREGDYRARFQRACEMALAAPGTAVAPSLLDQCAAKIRESCGDGDSCDDIFRDVRGSLADGAPCEDDLQCASGECSREGTAQGVPTCGKCAPAKQIGEACPEGGCVAGAACRTTIDGTEQQQTCVAVRIAGEGETCGTPGGTNEAIRCASGLYCQYSSSSSGGSTGKCAVPAGEGSPCGITESAPVQCKAPLACVNEHCGPLLGAGEACTSSGDCANGLGCDRSSEKCTAIVWGASGAECNDEILRCDRGFCRRTADSSGTSETGKCTDYIPDGQPCDDQKGLDQSCEPLSRCIDGTCQFPDPAQCK
jgi:hypothetical protein